jgi:hypothetical protein
VAWLTRPSDGYKGTYVGQQCPAHRRVGRDIDLRRGVMHGVEKPGAGPRPAGGSPVGQEGLPPDLFCAKATAIRRELRARNEMTCSALRRGGPSKTADLPEPVLPPLVSGANVRSTDENQDADPEGRGCFEARRVSKTMRKTEGFLKSANAC